MWHRMHYYVHGEPLITDAEYDRLEMAIELQWSVSAASHTVGSSLLADYPMYIREGRRPNKEEREERDRIIAERWMENM